MDLHSPASCSRRRRLKSSVEPTYSFPSFALLRIYTYHIAVWPELRGLPSGASGGGWRRGWDSNPRARFCQATRFRGGLFQPLRHLSARYIILASTDKSHKRATEALLGLARLTQAVGRPRPYPAGCPRPELEGVPRGYKFPIRDGEIARAARTAQIRRERRCRNPLWSFPPRWPRASWRRQRT